MRRRKERKPIKMSELTMELLAGMYKNAVTRIAELEREKRQLEALDNPDYRPNRESLSNSEIFATGVLAQGAVLNISRELLALRKIVAAYNTSGCADADAMAIAYLDARETIAKLETALGDIQEIADRETNCESLLIEEIVLRSMAALAK